MNIDSLIYQRIVHLFGPIESHKIVEIMDLDPTLTDLQIAASYYGGLTDVMGEERQPLAGISARIFEIVIRDEPSLEEEQMRA